MKSEGNVMKKVSIVIPAYNSAKTLDRCYQSILNQTYQNFEVITVEDGSKDNTLEIMKKYAAMDSRFIAVNLPKNGGVSRARNEGIKRATGEYLQFMDSDDDLNPEMIEKMVALLEKNQADLAICRFNHPFFKTYCTNRVFDMDNQQDFLELFQDTFALTVPWNKIWRRECFTEPFDVEEKFSEDELCNLANLVNVKKVATTDEYLYNYFVDPNNGNSSCISGIVNTPEFWKNKKSIYFLGANLVPKRKAIIEKAIRDKKIPVKSVSKLAYIRALDYFFAQLAIYFGIGVSEKALVQEMLAAMSDKNFKSAYRAEERNGLRLKLMLPQTREVLVRLFVRCCHQIYEERANDSEFKMSYAFITLFLALFAEKSGRLNTVSLQAKLFDNYLNISSFEAKYVKGILDYDFVFNFNRAFVFSNSFTEQLAF